jgi:hypothetical protein
VASPTAPFDDRPSAVFFALPLGLNLSRGKIFKLV